MSQPNQSQTQLQELASAIRRNQQYLQAQENQLERNNQLLQTQLLDLSQLEADLKQKRAKLSSLTTDTQDALASLKKQAEQESTKKLISIRTEYDSIASELQAVIKERAEAALLAAEAQAVLSTLDEEIIEADTLYKALLDDITDAHKRLRKAEREATFQVAIVADLNKEADALVDKAERADKTRLALEKAHKEIEDDLQAQTSVLASIQASIDTKTKQMEKLSIKLVKVSDRLRNVSKEEKTQRKALAEKELIVINERARTRATLDNLKVKQQGKPKSKIEPIEYYKI